MPRVVHANLDADRTLAHRRQRLLGRQQGADARLHPEAQQPRGGQHDRIELPVVELRETGIDVATQIQDAQIRASGPQLALPPQAGSTDNYPCGNSSSDW